MSRRVHTLTIPSSTRYLEDVRQFVESHASRAKFSEDIVEQLKMAVDEACANVIEHAYKGQDEHAIDIAVIVKPDRFTVRIRDEGVGFNQSSYSEPDIRQLAKARQSGGFGVHIIRKLMDQVEYGKRGGKNVLSLTKYRP